MKKLIIALVAFFAAWNAQAQIGIVAGITSSATDIKTAVAEVGNVTQYHAGITYKLGIGNLLAIQPSLIYNMKGTKLSALSLAGIDYKTGYLELPVQVQLGFGIGELARVYGFAEPFVGYAITNQINIKTAVADAKPIKDSWDNVKNRLEYGVGLGVGAELFRHLQVSVKYFWNVGEVYGAEGVSIDAIKEAVGGSKCNGIAASVAYLF